MILKQYENYLAKLFLKNILLIIIVFTFLSFFLNIFEEIKYFENKENEIYYPIILTILNILYLTPRRYQTFNTICHFFRSNFSVIKL